VTTHAIVAQRVVGAAGEIGVGTVARVARSVAEEPRVVLVGRKVRWLPAVEEQEADQEREQQQRDHRDPLRSVHARDYNGRPVGRLALTLRRAQPMLSLEGCDRTLEGRRRSRT